MKNVFVLFFFVVCFELHAQNTSYKIYNTPVNSNNIIPASLTYGNSHFNAFSVINGNGLNIQKNDLEGVPLTARNYSVSVWNDYLHINVYSGFIYLTGIKRGSAGAGSQIPFIAKIDTFDLSMVYLKEFPIGINDNSRIWQSRMLKNGDILMCGEYESGNDLFGLIIGVGTSSGNILYTNTLSVAGAINNFVGSVEEISNSTVIFTGASAGMAFIGLAYKTPSGFSVSAVHNISHPGKIDQTSNHRKLLLHHNTALFKLDTNLSLLSSTPAGLQLPGVSNSNVRTYFIDDRVYRLANFIEMDIYDTALVNLAYNSYSVLAVTYSAVNQVDIGYGGHITKHGANLFINSAVSQTVNRFYLLKTDLTGYLDCSERVNSQFGTAIFTSSGTFFSKGVPAYTTNTDGAVSNTLNISVSTSSCLGTSTSTPTNTTALGQNNSIAGRILIWQDGAQYQLFDKNGIKEIWLFDLSGKILFHSHSHEAMENVTIDLSDLQTGMYILSVADSFTSLYRQKFILTDR
jgi:hypothetical protein